MFIITKKYIINYDNIEYICPSTETDQNSLFRIYFQLGNSFLVSYFNTKEDMDKAFKDITTCIFYNHQGAIISEFEK